VIVNTQLNWTEPSGHATLGVFARNLTNKRPWINYAGLTFGDYGQRNAPRVIGIKAGFQY
jgi:iron complex outermembrane recepter protein